MVKTVGFYSSGSIDLIGLKKDILAFFWSVNEFVVKKYPQTDWSLITDRFYKRYLKLEELDSAFVLMEKIQEIFATIPTNSVNWPKSMISRDSRLNLKGKFLAEAFNKFFESFKMRSERALLHKKIFNTYNDPLRIMVADLLEYRKAADRPLSDYDKREGEPFWLR